LRAFFDRKKATIGYNKAIVALAHKLARIIWHLIVNDEIYEDNVGFKKKNIKFTPPIYHNSISVDECITIIFQANAVLTQKDPDRI